MKRYAFLISVLGGILASFLITTFRIEAENPETTRFGGRRPNPFAHLIGKTAPRKEIESLRGSLLFEHSSRRQDARVLSYVDPACIDCGDPSSGPAGTDAWILVFTDSNCSACDATYPSLPEAVVRLPVLVVGVGDRAVLRKKLQTFAVEAIFDSLQIVPPTYQLTTFPSALLIDRQGIVRHGAIGPSSVDFVVRAFDILLREGTL